LEPTVVRGLQPGGQLTITTDVENFPGFAEVIQGPWLMEQMETQAAHVGAHFVDDVIVSSDLTRRPFVLQGDSGAVYTAEALIIATGAEAKWLGLPSEQKYRGAGVSACATCDGFFFRSKEVAVVGGGNTAAEEALFLTHHAAKVVLIHRRNALRAEKILQQRVAAEPKISIIWDHVVDEIIGSGTPPSVSALKLRHVATGALRELAVDGLFVAIGHKPNSAAFQGQIDLDPEGYIKTRPGSTLTNVAGVFACGDVQDKIYRQAVTAAGSGCMAALDAEKYLAHASTAAAAE
jgi:thioredoxin reductase (NADPH)